MSNLIEECHLVNVDFENNSNKFIVLQLFDDGTVTSRWGRVGVSEQTKSWNFGADAKRQYEKKLNDKLKVKSGRDAYSKVDILTSTQTSQSNVKNADLKEIATKQIDVDCETTRDLIKWLSEVNIHSIVSSTTMTYNKVDGVFSTPLGVVGKPMVDRARVLLNDISPFVQNKDYKSPALNKLATEYLRVIPQNLGAAHRKLALDAIFTLDYLKKQADVLDALDASIASVLTTSNPQPTVDVDEQPKVFNVKLHTVSDDQVIDEVKKKFQETRQSIHTSYSYKVSKVYSVDIADMRQRWEDDGANLTNRMRLWHGTKPSNVLSILKQGLIIPPSTASYVCGRMFGNGVYFSDQSTKSLNYACGYWGGGSQGNRVFMFLADVGMGKFYSPTSTLNKIPDGYDSCFAKGGKTGLINNEMIVYRCSQCNLVYLVEFTR